MKRPDHPVWYQLQAHAQRCLQQLDLRQALQAPGRFARLSLQAPHVRLDCSKGLWDEAVLHDLLQLAQAAELPQRRAALLAGQMVNPTEGRPALHAALRAPFAPVAPHGLQHPVARCPDVEAGMHTMLALAEQLHAQGWFTDVLHLGIGGSSLGPELALQAAALVPRWT